MPLNVCEPQIKRDIEHLEVSDLRQTVINFYNIVISLIDPVAGVLSVIACSRHLSTDSAICDGVSCSKHVGIATRTPVITR